MPRAQPISRSHCPIGSSLDVLGDRWTLLVVRDLFHGKSRFGEIAQSPEKIPTNILADRLVRLEEAGIIESKTYQENPPRYAYSLTRKGRELAPVLGALAFWAMNHVPGVKADEKLHRMLRAAVR
ncbi:transcriptional regulator [Opitutaceae bacterium EW11]|nr:transcriptional regulator [Opitutaceae bacterium EW11]